MKRASQALLSSENTSATLSSSEFSAWKAKGTCAITLQLAIEFMYDRAVYFKNTIPNPQLIDNRPFK